VVRGAINLYESFTIGYRALTRSAEIAIPEEKQDNDKKGKKNAFLEKAYTTLSFVFAFAFSIGLFMYTPLWILSHFISKESAFAYNIFAGMIRIGLFLAYLILISFWKDIRRVFEYHGAEHKAIFTFEDGKELILENMRPYSTMHPRCGTSFLLLVGLVCILLFSIVDAAFIHLIGPYPHVIVRFVVHFLLVPLVAGTSYEVLRLSDKYQHLPIVSLLIRPGLWLQKITTREPDEHQLEVASSALKAAI